MSEAWFTARAGPGSNTEAFNILQVARNASTAQIKQAYRSRLRDLHPDTGDGADESGARFQAVVSAYQKLSKLDPGSMEMHPCWDLLPEFYHHWARELGHLTAEGLEEWITSLGLYEDEDLQLTRHGMAIGQSVAAEVVAFTEAAEPSAEDKGGQVESDILAVLAYRQHLGNEQWRVRWAGDAMEETWERLDVIGSPSLLLDATAMRPPPPPSPQSPSPPPLQTSPPSPPPPRTPPRTSVTGVAGVLELRGGGAYLGRTTHAMHRMPLRVPRARQPLPATTPPRFTGSRAPAVYASSVKDVNIESESVGDDIKLRSMFVISLALRSVGPFALLLTALRSLQLVALLPSWRWLHWWLACEGVFYALSYAVARRLSTQIPPPPLSRARRRELWQRILDDPGCGGSVTDFASAWFRRSVHAPPVALLATFLPPKLRRVCQWKRGAHAATPPVVTYDELHICDVEEWLAWGLLGKRRSVLDAIEVSELRDLILDLERAAGRRLAPPRARRVCAEFRPMRPQVDDVRWTAHPLLYYAISHLVGRELYTPRSMRAAHFGARLKCADDSPGVRLSYFYRPGASESAQQPIPFVFIHGIGVGPAPYAAYLEQLGEASGAAVIAIEVGGFAQRLSLKRVLCDPGALSVDPPPPADFAAAVQALLARHGHTSAHLVGHSLGTAYVSYVAKHAPSVATSSAFIDPINLGMHDAGVTRAFMYTPADTLQHEVDNYYFKTELFTSHVVARSLWWYEAAQWPQEASADRPTLVALCTLDEIVPTDAVRDSWASAGLRERGVRVHEMDGLGHGGWLFDEEVLSGLVRANLDVAALAPTNRLRQGVF